VVTVSSPLVAVRPRTTDTSPPSLHDALPISRKRTPPDSSVPPPRRITGLKRDRARARGSAFGKAARLPVTERWTETHGTRHQQQDRKSTRLNSSHVKNSYAVFCLKKKRQDEC